MKVSTFIKLFEQEESIFIPTISSKKEKASLFSGIRIISRNLIRILENFVKGNRNLFESIIIKGYFRLAMLKSPKNFKILEITEDNKQSIINYLIYNKEHVKIIKSSVINDALNAAVDIIFTKEKLKSEVVDNLNVTYHNIMGAIAGVLSPDIKKSKTFKTAIESSVLEILSIEQFKSEFNIPEYHSEQKNSSKTHIVRHPKGEGKFPDGRIYFRNDSIAKKIKEKYDIHADSKILNIDSKKKSAITAQRTDNILKKSLGDNLFNKIFTMPLKTKKTISGKEILSVLKALRVDFEKKDNPVLINVGANTKKQIQQIDDGKIKIDSRYNLVRNTLGSILIQDGNKTLLALEVSFRGKGKEGKEEEKKKMRDIIVGG